MANTGAWTGKGGTARDDMEIGIVEVDSKGYAATVEVGRRGTRDEECTWPLHNHYHHSASLGAERIVKTVHLNQFAE